MVGLVGRRGFGGFGGATDERERRSSASARFRSCVRKRSAKITTTPSLVSRAPASLSSRVRTASGSEGERRASKRSCTAVATLLTFCPPGPEARTKRLEDLAFVDRDLVGYLDHGRP